MSQQNSNIACPQCGYQIDVNDILHHQIEADIQKKYNNELAKKDSHYQQQYQNLLQQQAQLDEQVRQQDIILQKRLQQEKQTLQQQIKQQLDYEHAAQLNAFEQELADKSTQLKEFNKVKADITRLQREKDEQKATITADFAQRFTERLKEEQLTLRSELTKKLQAQSSIQIEALQTELTLKSNELSEFNQAKAEIERLKREKNEQKEAIEAESAQRFNKQLKQEQQALREKITTEMKTEVSAQLNSLQQELSRKSEQLKELNQTKADLMRLEREKEELRGEVILEKEREFSEKLTQERLKIQRQVDENSELKVKELQKQLNEQKGLAAEMKRKAEQGSMQIQGEVQELAIEEWLEVNFPLDTIEEIKKGARGADCLQIVHTHRQQNCGTIYYESKRTKEFQTTWIEKFKNDIREKNASIGVLVTEAMPSNMPRMGLREGVWVCSFEEFKGLSAVLRETVIKLSEAVASQENKGDKMEMLYSYLTGNEFKLQVEGIVEGFSQMQKDLDSEKRSMARIWKQREKQLQKVLLNTTHMYGSIKGIAGSAVASVALLELGDDIVEEPTLKPIT
jgi:hypothetical protein